MNCKRNVLFSNFTTCNNKQRAGAV